MRHGGVVARRAASGSARHQYPARRRRLPAGAVIRQAAG